MTTNRDIPNQPLAEPKNEVKNVENIDDIEWAKRIDELNKKKRDLIRMLSDYRKVTNGDARDIIDLQNKIVAYKKELLEKQKGDPERFGNPYKYQAFHILIGSTVENRTTQPHLDFPGEDSVISFLDKQIATFSEKYNLQQKTPER